MPVACRSGSGDEGGDEIEGGWSNSRGGVKMMDRGKEGDRAVLFESCRPKRKGAGFKKERQIGLCDL